MEAVADALDSDPSTLKPPLATVVDPDALDSLADSPPECSVEVTFTYANCLISLTDGTVEVQPTEAAD
ncbi:HalOD1 output domain-containing protein [Halobaculum marinum]|uniref:HalOD1 output domain-containing protein n=1 Tax=Halobaculum marinum TaxID=3031996 RepID=UPI0023E39062|nr:HalOD1 output domain-containing protein [Halobaculum sp. DT55]